MCKRLHSVSRTTQPSREIAGFSSSAVGGTAHARYWVMRSMAAIVGVVLMSVFATGCLGNVRGLPRVGPSERASGEPTHVATISATPTAR